MPQSWAYATSFAAVASLPLDGSQDRRPPCAFDTSAAILSVPAIVYLKPPPELIADPAARQEAIAWIVALGAHFQPPSRLTVGVRPIVPISHLGGPPDSIHFQLGGPLLLPLGLDGRLTGGPPIAVSGIASVNGAIVAAVHRLDSAGSLPIPTWRASSKAGPLRIQIDVSVDTVPGTLPLLRTRIPVYTADSAVSPIRFAKPTYPLASQIREETARVDVRYIVREDGTVDPEAVEVLYVSVDTKRDALPIAEGFTAAAIAAIGASRFNPARVRGCPVPTTVVQRVSFAVGTRSR